MCIKHANDLYRVVEAQHKTPGYLRGLVQAKIRSLKTAAISDHRFRSVDLGERAIPAETELESPYQAGGAVPRWRRCGASWPSSGNARATSPAPRSWPWT